MRIGENESVLRRCLLVRSGFRVQGLGFRVTDLGFGLQDVWLGL